MAQRRTAFDYSAQEAIGRLNSVAPQIKTELIPDAGHDLTMVQAELVNEKVIEFLKQRKFRSHAEARFLK